MTFVVFQRFSAESGWMSQTGREILRINNGINSHGIRKSFSHTERKYSTAERISERGGGVATSCIYSHITVNPPASLLVVCTVTAAGGEQVVDAQLHTAVLTEHVDVHEYGEASERDASGSFEAVEQFLRDGAKPVLQAEH